MQTLTKPITYQQFKALDFEEYELQEYIFELLNGEIMKRNYPTFEHQTASFNLALILGNFIKKINWVGFYKLLLG
jgi:Uma2 family endonuclease